jgi:hypothetical protein
VFVQVSVSVSSLSAEITKKDAPELDEKSPNFLSYLVLISKTYC